MKPLIIVAITKKVIVIDVGVALKPSSPTHASTKKGGFAERGQSQAVESATLPISCGVLTMLVSLSA